MWPCFESFSGGPIDKSSGLTHKQIRLPPNVAAIGAERESLVTRTRTRTGLRRAQYAATWRLDRVYLRHAWLSSQTPPPASEPINVRASSTKSFRDNDLRHAKSRQWLRRGFLRVDFTPLQTPGISAISAMPSVFLFSDGVMADVWDRLLDQRCSPHPFIEPCAHNLSIGAQPNSKPPITMGGNHGPQLPAFFKSALVFPRKSHGNTDQASICVLRHSVCILVGTPVRWSRFVIRFRPMAVIVIEAKHLVGDNGHHMTRS